MDEFVQENTIVNGILKKNFVILKVNFSKQNKNLELLNKYGDVLAFPHFFVLDSDGKLLSSQETGELESGDSYDESAFTGFLTKWKPAN